MRQALSILLIALLLLNVLGYYGLFLGVQYRNDRSMIKKLDAGDYEDSETVTIKVPIAIPYVADAGDFERVDGKFEYHGERYRLVKQKLAQDTLFIVCVKDHRDKKIQEVLSDFVQTFAGEPSDRPSNTKTAIGFIKDYLVCSFLLGNESLGWEIDILKESRLTYLIPAFYCSIIHPPERI